jgi:hypothetical protein
MATTLLVATAGDIISVMDFQMVWDIVLGCALLDHDCGFCETELVGSRE